MNPALGTTGIQFGKDMIPAPKISFFGETVVVILKSCLLKSEVCA